MSVKGARSNAMVKRHASDAATSTLPVSMLPIAVQTTLKTPTNSK
jgi:hypothetical protein